MNTGVRVKTIFKDKNIVFYVISSVVLLMEIIFLFVYLTSYSKVKKSVEKHEKRYREMLYLQNLVKQKGPAAKIRLLPKGKTLMGFVTTIARKNRIEYESIKPQTPIDKGTYLVSSVAIKMRGVDFNNLTKFIQEVENNSSVTMKIKRIKLQKNLRGNGMDAEIEIQTSQEK